MSDWKPADDIRVLKSLPFPVEMKLVVDIGQGVRFTVGKSVVESAEGAIEWRNVTAIKAGKSPQLHNRRYETEMLWRR
jgi:hypothetical protein